MTSLPSIQKKQIRGEILARRSAQSNKDALSREIIERLFTLPEYQTANTVLFYADVRSEVRTRCAFPEILKAGKRLVVPYCVGKELDLFWLRDLAELAKGRFGILEPEPSLRDLPDRRVLPEELDLLIVPGVAFDPSGWRLGHGQGFYDRLLARTPDGIPKIGLAFECQIAAALPTEPHDVPLDRVITERHFYSGGISDC